MTTANLSVVDAGKHTSLQDHGRFGYLRQGISASGPMDRFAFEIANRALGNPVNTPTIEISIAGISLLCTKGKITFAVAGGDFQVTCGNRRLDPWCIATLSEGEVLTIRKGRWGSWCYLSFAGNIIGDRWLGSFSTHTPSGLGGKKIAAGTNVEIVQAEQLPQRHATLTCPISARPKSCIRVVMGPKTRFFSADIVSSFLSSSFALTDAYDRMGVRLSGPTLMPSGALDMPSEAIVRGAIQVAGDGIATVLLADHQTTGGYPKIATVVPEDLNRFVQLRSHDQITFEAISPAAAVAAARTRARTRATYLSRFL